MLYLDGYSGDIQILHLAEIAIAGGMKSTLSYLIPDSLIDRVKPGVFVDLQLGKKQIIGMVWSLYSPNEAPKYKLKAIGSIVDKIAFNVQMLVVFKWMAKYYAVSPNRVLDVVLSKDWIKLVEGKTPKPTSVITMSELVPLRQYQQQAIDEIEEVGKSKPVLLHGITGSGKTRVFQEFILTRIRNNQTTLVLVPEINLTPQTSQVLEKALGVKVYLWHSNLGVRQKRETFMALQKDEAQVVLGTRSAIFLPFTQLDLIIVDEEHDQSYKQQDPSPRYHIREVAVMMAKTFKTQLLLASATPSLESWLAAEQSKFQLVSMNESANAKGEVLWQIIDMKEQTKLQGDRALSIRLREQLQVVINQGKQAILLLNKRGYSRARVCKSCGETQECLDCKVPVIYHRSRNTLLCHYCSRCYPVEIPCIQCESTQFIFQGLGIEQLEDEIKDWIEGAKVLRMDRDTTSKKGSIEEILGEFRDQKANILIGTQMVAKGHDFPNVDLVGVVNADTGLLSPDFRAAERNFQLLTQVAGRTGRHNAVGNSSHVILQSWQPSHPIFNKVKNANYPDFAKEELAQRQALSYPPYGRMALFEISSMNWTDLNRAVKIYMGSYIARKDAIGGQVLGPVEAPLARLKKKYRIQVLLKCRHANQLNWWLNSVVDECENKVPKGIQTRWDIDPYSMV